MIVTRDNFEDAMPLFEKALADCDFISYDLEMSGIENQRRGLCRKNSSVFPCVWHLLSCG